MKSQSQKKLIVIAGPTAVGKTSLSIRLAEELKAEIISADSRQFYKEISIGTAKPSFEEMKGIPHHFIDGISVENHYSAGMFEKEVVSFLDEYYGNHDCAILCGGSGMYIDAVCRGMDDFTEIDEHLRLKLNEEVKQNGIEWLQREVEKADPEYYQIVDRQNPARLQRALEVFRATGIPFSKQRKGTIKKRNFSICKILLDTDRNLLYRNINERVDEMMKNGLLDEVRSVYKYRTSKALNTVGYKELFEYLDGYCTLDRAVELIKQNTRRYAKRQLTWFNNDNEYVRFNPADFDKILQFTRKFLNGV